MNISKNLLLLSMAVLVGFSSCKKDEEPEPEPNTPTAAAPANPIPAPIGADAALVAIHTSTYITAPLVGEIYQPIGFGVGVFGDLAAGTYVSAGAVNLNTKALTAQSNQSYVFTPNQTAPTGVDFSSGANWTVAGGNGFAAFNHSTMNEVPSGPKYSGATTIARNAEFTLSSSIAILSADSVIFNVISPTVTLTKVRAGNISSCSFTAAEMGTLGAGSGYVQIVPYNYESATYGDKQIYFINESVSTSTVTFN
jgi:hypothetical protein